MQPFPNYPEIMMPKPTTKPERQPDQTTDLEGVASTDLLAVDPFATLPMEFRLDNRAILRASSMEDVKIEKMALIRAARERGLIVDQWYDHSTMEEVFRVRSANR